MFRYWPDPGLLFVVCHKYLCQYVWQWCQFLRQVESSLTSYPFWYMCIFPLFYFVKKKAVENIIWLEILWRAIMCNMCAFMHDGGYICDKRWQMYQETFWFLSKLHVFLQTKTQAIVNHQKNLACANLSYLNHIDIWLQKQGAKCVLTLCIAKLPFLPFVWIWGYCILHTCLRF